MYQYVSFTILCCLIVVGLANAAQLHSPCPNVFTYEGEAENDRWYGIMTFSSNIELVGLIYKIQLDRPGQLLVSWDGEVRSEDNINFSVFDPKHFQRPGEVVKARIMVKFNPSSNPPSVVKIVINGNIMCSGENTGPYTSGLTTESFVLNRPDPSFVDEDVVPDYSHRPSNQQNTNAGYEKGSRPNYYEPTYGVGTGTNFNTLSGSNPNYNSNTNGGESSYTSSSNSASFNNANPNYQSSVSSKPSSYPNNNNNNPNYVVNSGYSNTPNNYVPAENVVYPSNLQSSSNLAVVQSQWSTENQQSNFVNNRNGTSGQSTNSGPLVTTLTLPNATQNKNNVDTIIQIIKNQLEQQQGASNTNNTVIVALVSPVSGNQPAQQVVPNTSQSRDSVIETTTHRSTTNTQTTPVTSKVRSTTSPLPPTKNPNTRNNKD